jgi:hypothetical protein
LLPKGLAFRLTLVLWKGRAFVTISCCKFGRRPR